MLNKPGEAKKLLLNQFVLTVLLSLALIPFGTDLALSALLGGGIVVFAGLIMAILIFKKYRAQQPEKIIAGFYGAQIAKLVFITAAFVLIILNVPFLNFLTLITVFFIIQVVPAMFLAAHN
jgi:ATP synthase protein I